MNMPQLDQRQLEYMPIDSITLATRNAKRHNRTGIVNSIRTEGFIDALVIDQRTNQLIAGHGRLEALRWMRDNNEPAPAGIETADTTWLVPVQTGWASRDDHHAAAATIALNRWVERGGWDNAMLHEILAELDEYDDDLLSVAGYSTEDLDQLIKRSDEALAEFPSPDLDSFADPEPAGSRTVECPKCGHTWMP